MKKNNIRWLATLGILLVLYALIVFVIPFFHTPTFWVSFVFTLLSFAVAAAAMYLAFIKNPDIKSKFYGFPIAKIGAIYGIAQLIAGLIFMALAAYVPAWVPAVLYAVALGAALIGLIGAEATAEEIESQDVQIKKDTQLMRDLQSQMGQLAARTDNAAIKALAEEIRYSDPVSNPALATLEEQLLVNIGQLRALVADGSIAAAETLAEKTMHLLDERNRQTKAMKG